MASWLDCLSSLVITLLYPLSLLVDTDDITSQLLSSLSNSQSQHLILFTSSLIFFTGNDSSYYKLTVIGGSFQIAIQKREDVLVAGLHRLQRNVSGPVLQRVQGSVSQGNVAEPKL